VTQLRRGIGVAIAGVILTLVAFTFDAAPLFVPGVAFALIGIGVPAWVWLSADGASVTRRLPVERAVEGEPVEAMIEVTRGPLGLPGGEVLDPLAGMPVEVGRPLSLVTGGSHAEVRIVARFPRRGLRRLEPPSIAVSDMLGLAMRVRPGDQSSQELLVLPRTEPVRWSSRERGRRVEGGDGGPADEPLAASDIDGLRPYRPGTSASRIHWAALARGAGLLERRLQADGDARPFVILDARTPDRPDAEEQLDAAVRAAASLTLELARRGGCRVLLPGERRAVAVESDLTSWPGVHARLAMVEGGPTTRPPHLAPGAKLGPVLYVAAQPLDRIPTALATNGIAGIVLVLPRDASAQPAGAVMFNVAGCRGYAVGARARAGTTRVRAA
jgi:uncharacterized protein (DUF58 family)